MIGLRTDQGPTGALVDRHALSRRWRSLVAVVFAGCVRCARSLFGRGADPRSAASPTALADALNDRAAALLAPALLGLCAARAGAVLRQPLPARPRHPGADLCDARLGPEHRGRPRRPARPRLRRVLRGRRLLLRAAGDELRPVVLDLPAARRHPRGVLGRPARLSGAAAARRLSRHRHAGLRRDHPPRAAQLAELHRRAERHLRHPAADASSACRSPTTKAASPRSSGSSFRRSTASCSSST